MNMEARDLEPCPFCGGEAETGEWGVGWFVGCANEDCLICPETNALKTQALAAKAWNTRTHNTGGDDVERVARAIEIAIVERTMHHPIAKHLNVKWLWPSVARAAIASMPSLSRVRLDALEEAAKAVELYAEGPTSELTLTCDRIATAIRNLGAPNVEETR